MHWQAGGPFSIFEVFHVEASIMDGFAVCSRDGIGTFPVDADAFAGGKDEGPLRPGDV